MKKLGIGFIEQPIETVYDPDDYSSHYNAVKDSWKIFKVMLRFIFSNSSAIRYVISAVASWALDNQLYYVLFSVLGSTGAQITARVLSSLFNFNMNRSFVFRSRDLYWKDMLEYYCVCVPQTVISVVLLGSLVKKLSISAPNIATYMKIAVDTLLFCISYFIQKKWVFKETDK